MRYMRRGFYLDENTEISEHKENQRLTSQQQKNAISPTTGVRSTCFPICLQQKFKNFNKYSLNKVLHLGLEDNHQC